MCNIFAMAANPVSMFEFSPERFLNPMVWVGIITMLAGVLIATLAEKIVNAASAKKTVVLPENVSDEEKEKIVNAKRDATFKKIVICKITGFTVTIAGAIISVMVL